MHWSKMIILAFVGATLAGAAPASYGQAPAVQTFTLHEYLGTEWNHELVFFPLTPQLRLEQANLTLLGPGGAEVPTAAEPYQDGPLRGVRMKSGRWIGGSRLTVGPAIEQYETSLVAEGPVSFFGTAEAIQVRGTRVTCSLNAAGETGYGKAHLAEKKPDTRTFEQE